MANLSDDDFHNAGGPVMKVKTRQEDPTQAEIRRKCAEIREEWDEHRFRRSDIDSGVPSWEAPVVKMAEALPKHLKE